MPLTSLSYRDMTELAATHLCGECQGRLNVAWVNGQYVLRCANLNHQTITRHDKEYEKRVMEVRMVTQSLIPKTENGMMERIKVAKFPQNLNPAEMALLAKAALSYGLDPLMGEMTIYQGRPYVSIDGRRRKAQETDKYDGLRTRPATKEEKEAAMVPVDDYYWVAEVYHKDARMPFSGWGRVSQVEIQRAIDNANTNHKDPWVWAYRFKWADKAD